VKVVNKKGLGEVQGFSGSGVHGSRFTVQGSGFRVQGSRFRVHGSAVEDQNAMQRVRAQKINIV
jgi:hypothetical protein